MLGHNQPSAVNTACLLGTLGSAGTAATATGAGSGATTATTGAGAGAATAPGTSGTSGGRVAMMHPVNGDAAWSQPPPGGIKPASVPQTVIAPLSGSFPAPCLSRASTAQAPARRPHGQAAHRLTIPAALSEEYRECVRWRGSTADRRTSRQVQQPSTPGQCRVVCAAESS